jgi:hypothetical protein
MRALCIRPDRSLLYLFEKNRFGPLVVRFKGMYFWTEVDALKSVKYILAPNINHDSTLGSRGE